MPVPSGALVYLNFETGEYFDGANAVPADVIDHPEWIVDGALQIRFANETVVGAGSAHIIGNALTELLTGNWTVVIKMRTAPDSPSCRPFTVTSAPTPELTWDDAIWVLVDPENEIGFYDANTNVSLNRYVENVVVLGTSEICQFAMTRTADKFHVSVNGGAVQFDPSEQNVPSFAPTVATFGAFDTDDLEGEFDVLSLAVYPPQDDSDLPALSSGQEPEPEPQSLPQELLGTDPTQYELRVRAWWAEIESIRFKSEEEKRLLAEKRKEERRIATDRRKAEDEIRKRWESQQ